MTILQAVNPLSCTSLHFVQDAEIQYIVTSYVLDAMGFESRQRQEIFSSPKLSKPDVGSIQSPIRWVPGLFPGRVVMLTTHLHLMPRLRTSGAIHLLPLYAFHGVGKENFYQPSSTNLFRSHYMSLWHSHAIHVSSF
jgi:hypothetical protein